MNYYPHHIGDFDRATRHLTRIERSIYRDLIDLYYETESQLTLDMALLCRKVVARTEEEKAAVLAVLDEFFHQTPNGWYHDRCEEELAEYRKNRSQASAAGKASAAARAERRRVALGNPTTVERPLNDRSTTGQREANDTATNQEPVTKNQRRAPKPPDGGLALAPEPKKSSRGTVLQTFLDECRAKGERPLRDYAPLWAYCKAAGLHEDFVALAWVEFCRRFTGEGTNPGKLQKDWRGTFRKYVENNYFKLWAVDREGGYFLTAQGKQAQKVHETKEAA